MYRLVSLLLLVVALTGGCVANNAVSSNPDVLVTEQLDATDPRILIVYGNPEFKDKLFVIRKIMDDKGKLPKCSVTIQNVSNDIFVVEYQFRWIEESGMPVMQSPAWGRLTLAPHAVKPLINMAKVPAARNVEFTVRLPLAPLYELPPEPEKK